MALVSTIKIGLKSLVYGVILALLEAARVPEETAHSASSRLVLRTLYSLIKENKLIFRISKLDCRCLKIDVALAF